MSDKPTNIASGSADTDTTLQQEVGRNEGQVVGQMTRSQAYSVREAGVFVSGGTVVFQNGESGQLPSSSAQNRTIPSLLPYLPNRSDQEFALREAIQAYLQLNKRSPLICIIHGDELQCHDKFLERIQKRSISNFFQLDPNKAVIKDYLLDWPSELKSLEYLPDYFCRKLAEVVGEASSASVEKVNQAFCTYPYPVIVHVHLLTENWDKQGLRILDKLLQFWNGWPQLTQDQQLVIWISVQYQIKRYQKPSLLLLLKPWKFLQAFFKRHKCKKLNQDMQSQLSLLEQSDFSQYENVFGVVLPQLLDISRTDVENWIRAEETKKFIGEGIIGQQILGTVRDLFDRLESQTSFSKMPMENLSNELIQLLKLPFETNK